MDKLYLVKNEIQRLKREQSQLEEEFDDGWNGALDCVLSFINDIEKEERMELTFIYGGKEVHWDDIPLEIRKHDYPYYFDDEGNDCYPHIKQ